MGWSCRVFAAAGMVAVWATGPVLSQEKPKAPPASQKKTPRKPPAAAAAPQPPAPAPASDVRFVTRQTQSAQVSSVTTYIRGARQRVEFPGIVAIEQCDLQRTVTLNPSARRYRLQPYGPPAVSQEAAPAPAAPAKEGRTSGLGLPGRGGKGRGGTVTLTTTITDTLERETIHGFEARHVKTALAKTPGPGACDRTVLKVDVDAWYIDPPQEARCTPPAASAPAPAEGDACVDRLETQVVGTAKLGLPVRSTTTTTAGEGDRAEVTTTSQEVTALEITRLDAALFEIPEGYTEVTDAAGLLPPTAGATLSDALFGSTADGTSTAAPRRPGVVRIGVLEPVNKTTAPVAGASLRRDLVETFKAGYEAIPLAGPLSPSTQADARRFECDYILATEITEIKTARPGRMGSVMRVTGSAPKDMHEVKLEYKLFAVDSLAAPKLGGSTKASSGGFGVGSALRLAAFAGRLYIGFAMMGGMGMMNGNGGAAAGPLASYFDPRTTIMGAMTSSQGASLEGDAAEAAVRDTVREALDSAAKSTMEQLSRRK